MSDASPVPTPTVCPICRQGCSCPVGERNAGCQHYGCGGMLATEDCPGVPFERARADLAARARWLNARTGTQTRLRFSFA